MNGLLNTVIIFYFYFFKSVKPTYILRDYNMQAIMFVPFSLKLIFPCIPHNYSVSKNHTTLLFLKKSAIRIFLFYKCSYICGKVLCLLVILQLIYYIIISNIVVLNCFLKIWCDFIIGTGKSRSPHVKAPKRYAFCNYIIQAMMMYSYN